MGNWPIKILKWGMALWTSLGKFEECIKVVHVNQIHVVIDVDECIYQCVRLRWPPWSMGCNKAEMGSI